MIYYLADPMDLLANQEPTKQRNYRLPSGGILTTEVLPDNRIRVLSLTSTDPADYMNASLAPGQIMDLKIDIK